MKFRSAAIGVLAAAVPFSAPVFAHHSQAMFDATQEILIEGTVHRYDWKNPHIYLIVDTIGPDGKRALIEGEGLAITQALVDGLRPDAFEPGMRVVMRANPNRGGWGKQVRILDVTTEDGEIHPFYAANKRTLELKPAESIASKWAPSRQAVYAAFSAMANWPLKAEALAIKEQAPIDGLCYVEPVPFLAILDEMRSIEVHDDRVLLHFDNSGDHVYRTVYLNAEHPADLEPSLHGHSVGWWEGDTLVIDTIGYEANLAGLGGDVHGSDQKRTVERLSLSEDRVRLRYEITIEDPVYLERPVTLAQQWDHRPDLEFSPPSEACDDEVAARWRDHVPEELRK